MGKTQLVLDYVQRHRTEYKATFWIEAGQKESLERDIIYLYRTLFDLAASGGYEPVGVEDALVGTKSWFSGRQGPWLMVFDSADAIEDEKASGYIDIRHFIPDVASLHVIITSRSSAVAEMTQLDGVQVGEMEEAQATELFYSYSRLPRTDVGIEDEVKAIVRELGCLALAVTLAGSYVGTTERLQSDVKGYLQEYRQRRRELLERKSKRIVHQYSESVLTTWETSYQAVSEQCSEASVLLAMLSCLNSDDIFPGLFSVDKQLDNATCMNEDEDASWTRLLSPKKELDRYMIEEWFRVLQKFSFVQWKADQQSYAMHKLFHAWGLDRLKECERHKISQAAFRLVVEAVKSVKVRPSPDEKLRLVPHVMANFATFGGLNGSWHEAIKGFLDGLSEIDLLFYSVGKWSEEYAVQETVLQERRRMLGDDHLDTITALSDLAVTLRNRGELNEAAEIMKDVLERRRQIRGEGEERLDFIMAMSNLANILGDQGQLEEAAEMKRKVLEEMRQIHGEEEEHPDTITAIINLANTLADQGQLDKAAKMEEEVLEKRRHILGEEHPDTIKAMSSLAITLRDQGQLDKVAEILREVLEKRRRILGQEHPDTITAKSNLAIVLRDQGQLDKAVEMEKDVLEKRRQILGEEHPDTITAMNNFAIALEGQGQLGQAVATKKKVLETRRRILGEEHPDTLTAMSNLANSLRDEGEAANMLREVLEKRQRILGEEHPDTITVMGNLAIALEALGDQVQLDKAVEMLRDVLERRRRILGEDHPDTKTAAQNLCIITERQSMQPNSVRTLTQRRPSLFTCLCFR